MRRRTFARGEWGGKWPPDFATQEADILVQELRAQSGFANADLDFQLKQHGINHVALVGLLANNCVESTARDPMELGYRCRRKTRATCLISRRSPA